jgi:hypothetical protein
MYIEGEVPYISGGNGNGGMWGQDSIWAILLLALLGNGFGYRGGYGGAGGFVSGDALGYELGKVATTNDVASGFNNSALLGGINELKLGQTSGFAGVQQTLCQGFSGVNTSVLTGFNGVDKSICTLGYNLTSQIADCCCGVKSAIADLKYANEAQTCQLITNQNANTQRIIDYLTTEKIESLRAENVALKGKISNDMQTGVLLNAINRVPIPAYVVPNPYNPTTTPTTAG